MFEIVYDGQPTDGCRLDGYTISSPCEPKGSGELNMMSLECSQDFSHYKSMGIFSRSSRADNSAVLGPIWPNFELVRDVMDVLVTCKFEEDSIKNEGARAVTTLYSNFSEAQGQITLVLVSVSGRNLNSSKLLCMSSLPARMSMIDSKMKELECSQDFSHYKSMGIFPDAQGQLTLQSLVRSGLIFKLDRDVMDVLVTCKYEEDPIKNEGARVVTTFSPL